MTYSSLIKKLYLENILIWPLVALGKLCGKLFPLSTKHRIFLFFPNADIGGSPKVNIDITNCIKSLSPIIIFSKKPKNNLFLERFQQTSAKMIDLHRCLDNKIYHFVNIFYRGVIASWIHRQPEAAVLGGECIFFYKIVPHLQKRIRKVEVCHLDTWLNYSIGFAKYINVRVFSTEQLKRDVETQYNQSNFSQEYFKKLYFIENTINIPSFSATNNDVLQIVFIGRGSPQKRVHLAASIAKEAHEKKLPVHFSFIGDVDNVINIYEYPFAVFHGNVKDKALLEKIYDESDVLIMTSLFEGLPIVVMEMMARGKAIITTAVNGLPDYIQHNKNGFLIRATHEDEIIAEGVSYIENIVNNPFLKTTLGMMSRKIAIEKFSYQKFCFEYENVLHLNRQ